MANEQESPTIDEQKFLTNDEKTLMARLGGFGCIVMALYLTANMINSSSADRLDVGIAAGLCIAGIVLFALSFGRVRGYVGQALGDSFSNDDLSHLNQNQNQNKKYFNFDL